MVHGEAATEIGWNTYGYDKNKSRDDGTKKNYSLINDINDIKDIRVI